MAEENISYDTTCGKTWQEKILSMMLVLMLLCLSLWLTEVSSES